MVQAQDSLKTVAISGSYSALKVVGAGTGSSDNS